MCRFIVYSYTVCCSPTIFYGFDYILLCCSVLGFTNILPDSCLFLAIYLFWSDFIPVWRELQINVRRCYCLALIYYVFIVIFTRNQIFLFWFINLIVFRLIRFHFLCVVLHVFLYVKLIDVLNILKGSYFKSISVTSFNRYK